MKNQGISLISLIITIIVIIILAAIVIFTGLGTPDSAQFAKFTSQVDDVYTAVLDQYSKLKVSHATKRDTRTNEQIYLEIATGFDNDQYTTMGNNRLMVGSSGEGVADGVGVQLIKATKTAGFKEGSGEADTNQEHASLIADMLPEVRQSKNAWYVTEDGRVFNANGFAYDGKVYVDASHYFASGDLADLYPANQKTNYDRAAKVWAAMEADRLQIDQ